MEQVEQIEIQPNNTRERIDAFISLLGSACITVFLLLFISDFTRKYEDALVLGTIPNDIFIQLCFQVLIGMFLIAECFLNLISKKSGIILSQDGMNDCKTCGFIYWSDIEEIRFLQRKDTIKRKKFETENNKKLLVIMIRNPNYHINKNEKGVKKEQMKKNYETYGSPICIYDGDFKINIKVLYNLIDRKLQRYRLQKIKNIDNF